MITIKKSTEKDLAHFITVGLRASDVLEQKRMSGGKTEQDQAVNDSFYLSENKWTAFFNEAPVGIFGLVPHPNIMSSTAVLWFVATEEAESNKMMFLKASIDSMEKIKASGFSRIWNYVDAKNTKSVKWLKYLGFKLSPTVYSINGNPFYHFSMEV